MGRIFVLMGRCAPGWCLLVISCTLCVCHPPTENTTSTPVVGPYEPPFFEASCDALTRIKDGLDGKGLHMAPTQKFGMLGTFDLCMYGLHNCELAARRAAQQFPQRTQSIDQYIRSVTNVSHAVEKTLSQAVREPTTILRVREVAQTTLRVLGSCRALLEPLQTELKAPPAHMFNLTSGPLPDPPWPRADGLAHASWWSAPAPPTATKPSDSWLVPPTAQDQADQRAALR